MISRHEEIQTAKQLASFLPTPVFIVDMGGTLLFYNVPAEYLLGRKFDETGEVPASSWTRMFLPTDENGIPLLPDDLPLMIALKEHHPSHGELWISGLDNVRRHLQITALPLISTMKQHLGAMAIFWEEK